VAYDRCTASCAILRRIVCTSHSRQDTVSNVAMRPTSIFLLSALSVGILSPTGNCALMCERHRTDRAITTPACVIAWLLCAVSVCLVVHPSHCDLCDVPFTAISPSPQTVVNPQQPTTPERCNGICWCCGFHGLPNASPHLGPVNTITSNVRPEPLSPVFVPRSSIFRPPRTNVSS
jgi:hypothetical protein